MNYEHLSQIAQQMVADGKGILAADESMPTCKKRFEALGVESTESTRQDYRELLLTAPGIENYLSGVILFEETFYQNTKDGVPFREVLAQKGILPGIKVDKGAKDLALHPGEKVTEGLDGLRERLHKYYEDGARFAKWRAVIKITEDGLPTEACTYANAHALARYAALCQEANIVPIVEPEILIDGNHSLDVCYDVTADVIDELFDEMIILGVHLPGTILKASMVIAGLDAPEPSTPEQVADRTVECLQESVPEEVPGVVFLSGGQTEIQSTRHLHLMNERHRDLPWKLSFSYGRAIQQPALQLWAQDAIGNRERAMNVLRHRCEMNSLATLGQWSEEKEA